MGMTDCTDTVLSRMGILDTSSEDSGKRIRKMVNYIESDDENIPPAKKSRKDKDFEVEVTNENNRAAKKQSNKLIKNSYHYRNSF